MTITAGRGLAAIAVLAALLTGCSDDPPTAPTGLSTPSASAPASSEPADAGATDICGLLTSAQVYALLDDALDGSPGEIAVSPSTAGRDLCDYRDETSGEYFTLELSDDIEMPSQGKKIDIASQQAREIEQAGALCQVVVPTGGGRVLTASMMSSTVKDICAVVRGAAEGALRD